MHLHKWKKVKTWRTILQRAFLIAANFEDVEVNIARGYECEICGKRKLKERHYGKGVGENIRNEAKQWTTQQA